MYFIDWNKPEEKTELYGNLIGKITGNCKVTIRYVDSNNVVLNTRTEIIVNRGSVYTNSIINKPQSLIITWTGLDKSETKIFITLNNFKGKKLDTYYETETLEVYGHTGDIKIYFDLDNLYNLRYTIKKKGYFSKSISRIVQNGIELFNNKKSKVQMQTEADPNEIQAYLQRFMYEEQIQQEINKYVSSQVKQIYEDDPNISDELMLSLIKRLVTNFLRKQGKGAYIDNLIIDLKKVKK